MPANKRQHYVPKHMLKRFARDKDLKQVNLIHIPSRKIVFGASLRDQCHSDYFYSNNLAIEKSLSEIEGHQSRLIDDIISTKKIDKLDNANVATIFSLQRSRTMQAKNESSYMAEKLIKMAMHGRIAEDILRKIRLDFRDSASLNVSIGLRTSPIIYDLEQLIVVNETDVPFIISDNPVVSTNWFCRLNYPMKNGLGLASSGLQMIMPISPGLAILLLDSSIYKVDAPKGFFTIRERKHVQSINDLQWINANNTVYFPPSFPNELLSDLTNSKNRKDQRFLFQRLDKIDGTDFFKPNNKDEYEKPSDGVSSEIISMRADRLSKDIRLPAIKMRQNKKFFDDGTMASPLRDPIWLRIVNDFEYSGPSDKISYISFLRFIDKHPLRNSIGPWWNKLLGKQIYHQSP